MSCCEELAGRGRCASTCCRTHYRQPIDWTKKGLEELQATLDRWGEISDRIGGSLVNGSLPRTDVVDALAGRSQHAARHRRACTSCQGGEGGQTIAAAREMARLSGISRACDVCAGTPRASATIWSKSTDLDLAMRVKSLIAPATPPAKPRTSRKPTASATSLRPWASAQGCEGPGDRRDRHDVGGGAMTPEQGQARDVERRLPVRRRALQGRRSRSTR